MRQPAIRNVILVGPAGAGKTTLAESLLAAAGAVRQPGTVATGSTTSDHNEIETELGRSVVLTPLSFSFADTRITLLDTPGFADFVGEVRAGLRAADAALFVVGAGEGIDAATIMLWQECAAVGMPRAVVVTGVDRGGDFDEEIALARRAFGDGVQPMYLPMLADDESLAGLIGLLTQSVYDYSTGTRTSRESDPQHRELVEEARAALIEGIITESEDETLMERFLGGEELAIDMLVDDLEKAVARGHFHPVLPVGLDPQRPVGMLEVLELIVGGFPTPAEHPLPTATTPDGRPGPALACDPQGPLCAEVVQTTSDQFAGRLSLVRVFSGTLRADTVLHVSGHFLSDRGHDDHDTDERAGAISSALGAQLTPVSAGVAGDIVTVARLSRAETGDTLSDPATPLLVEPWLMPDPLLPLAVSADSRQDEDKLSTALGRLQAEDPTVRIERNAETHQVVLWSMGQTHADVLLDRLRRRFGVHVTAEPLKIALRTTLAGPAKGHGRLVTRTVKAVAVPAWVDWPGAAQVLQVRRTRIMGGRKHIEVVYAVSSVPMQKAPPRVVASWIQGHWGIENALHWVRDVTFDEDRHQLRIGSGPRVMATLRNTGISLLRLAGWASITAGLRHHARDSRRPIKLLAES